MLALQRSLATVGVDLDTNLTTAANGDLVVGVTTVPETPEHREWMRAAIHIAINEDFPGLASYTVLVPPAVMTPPPANVTEDDDAASLEVRLLATMLYKQVVAAFPWRDRAGMYARLPGIVDDVVCAQREGRIHPLTTGNVDALLPPCHDRLLYNEICLLCACEPRSLFEWYQLIYWRRDATPHIGAAARVLFV